MQRRITLLFLTVVVFAASALAQNGGLYLSKGLEKVYQKGTRTLNGAPGPNYWQNHSDYKIKAELNTETRTLTGHEVITYHNESPDSLKQLVVRLYQDVMKKGNARDFTVSAEDLTDGVKIDTFIFNGTGININDRQNRIYKTATNLLFGKLPEPIAPKTSATIEVKWSLLIPKESRIRMGAYDENTFYVAYWYPQIAVYDDIDGWDRNEYSGMTEFYNDFSNYDFEVTVPGKNLVWASGVVQNAQEILKPEIYARYEKAKQSDEVIRIVTQEDYKNGGVTNGKEKNTWKFKAENVTDVSFATAANYNWDGASVVVDDKTGRRVLTDAAYQDGNKFWDETAYFAQKSVEFLSKEWPGVPYPYPKVTTFNGEKRGGGGMEMPMMTNNGSYEKRGGQIGVTMHEIAHTYFPFYMGTNERKYAWMDEGWATFLTYELADRMDPEAKELEGIITPVSRMMGMEADMPIYTLSSSQKGMAYGVNAYQKPAAAYYILRDYLGADMFRKALHEYMDRWHGKHPFPYDFFYSFNDATGEDLNWFWKPWFFEKGFPDIAIKNVKTVNEEIDVDLEKVGSVPVPAEIKITYKDGSTESVRKNAGIWSGGNSEYTVKVKSKKPVEKVELNTEYIPDSDASNNSFEIK